MRVAYLGPPGTFSEEALAGQPELATAVRLAAGSIAESIELVRRGAAEAALVPLDNTTSGTVEETRLSLARHPELVITDEVTIEVHHHLLAVQGGELATIGVVISHPAALRQCAGYLARNLPAARREESASTASAAEIAAARGSPAVAAIASRRAAQLFGLAVLAGEIEDGPANRTRFVLVTRRGG